MWYAQRYMSTHKHPPIIKQSKTKQNNVFSKQSLRHGVTLYVETLTWGAQDYPVSIKTVFPRAHFLLLCHEDGVEHLLQTVPGSLRRGGRMYVVPLPCLTLNSQSISFKNDLALCPWFWFFHIQGTLFSLAYTWELVNNLLKVIVVIMITVLRWILGTWGN